MKRIHLLVLLSALALPFAAAPASGSGSGSVVVAEVFAAGGNSGARLRQGEGRPWARVPERPLRSGLSLFPVDTALGRGDA
jgi:hypothetical protein